MTQNNHQTCNCPHEHKKPRIAQTIAIGAVCLKQLLIMVIWFAIMSIIILSIPEKSFNSQNIPVAVISMFLSGLLVLSLHETYCRCRK